MKHIIFLLLTLMLLAPQAFASPEFKFDFATQVTNDGTYTKHWSDVYPPDPKADIIFYSAAYNVSYERLTALRFLYVVYDPYSNVVAVQTQDSFNRNYGPSIVFSTLHPGSDWLEGIYKVKIVVYDMIDRDAFKDNVATDPFAIGMDPDKYKTFYETGSNAGALGILLSRGNPIAQAVLNFRIDRSVTIYPPDRFLLHDVKFTDGINDRIVGEKLQIEVKLDNNYKEDGTVKLAMLVDSALVSTQEVTVKGLNTSTVLFDAKAGKLGTFKLHFGADTPDVKYKNAELTFTIKNESDATRLDVPKITITGMNINKEFVPFGENVTVSVSAINNGKTGSKTITVYSNRVPVGSAEMSLLYLEEKTVEIPLDLKNKGINKITVSDAPALFRNVFVQDAETSSIQDNPVLKRVSESPLKVSMVVVFLAFAGVLYYIRNRLKYDDFPAATTTEAVLNNPMKTVLPDLGAFKNAGAGTKSWLLQMFKPKASEPGQKFTEPLKQDRDYRILHRQDVKVKLISKLRNEMKKKLRR
ncbi:Uncharacterised protein [uncultured archaeon]|nr:Uncharacterised protein [uncultured archaeon]